MDQNPTPLPPASLGHDARAGRPLQFATRSLPWLLAGLMLLVYGLTLNPWVSPDSLLQVARLENLSWGPTLIGPATFLLTYPFGWLPAGWVPVAANLFTAVCAALTLALLARSVALLPHDLTQNRQQRRRREPPKLLANRMAWVPPLVAVLVCGLQLSFWQSATAATPEMLNLLMFAYVIRCLVEFNAGRKDGWLLRGALVYGVAVANDWAMAAFFPAFFVALIWMKRIFIFNEQFLKRLLKHPRSFKRHLLWQIPGCWLAGLSLFLLLPAVTSFSETTHLDFLPALKYCLKTYKAALTHFPRQLLVTSCLISVMPVFLMGIRFYHFLAGFNRLNIFIGSAFFQMVYGFFMLIGLWTMLDSPLSPRRLGLGMASLPLYFLGALSIGYFIGHFLLISEIVPEPAKRRRRRSSKSERRRKQQDALILNLKRAGLAGVAAVAMGIPTTLVYKNLPVITLKRADPCGDYIGQLERALPPDGAVLISNDSLRLIYLKAALIRHGREAGYLLIDTEALKQSAGYLDFLKEQNPRFNLETSLPGQLDPNNRPMLLVALLQELAKTYPIYCLPPAPRFEPLAEFFYFEPHGLLCQLVNFPTDLAFARPLPPERLQENAAFWQGFETQQLPGLTDKTNPIQPPPSGGLIKRFVNTLRFVPEPDREALIAGTYYAGALNDWGVELQKAGNFAAAGKCFAEALQLNPRNPAAQINQKFNADYVANREVTIQRPLETARTMDEAYRKWQHVVQDGLVDEPNFCYMLGDLLAAQHLARPAIAQFERVKELAPVRLDTYLSLTRLFVMSRDFTNALTVADEILVRSATNPASLFLKASVLMQMRSFKEAIPWLSRILATDPTNSTALLNRGMAYQGAGEFPAARRDYNSVTQMATNAFPAYFELAEMAFAETNRPVAITNYELYLKYAPPNAPDIQMVQTRLQQLKPAVPMTK